jgi:hypothetical protein
MQPRARVEAKRLVDRIYTSPDPAIDFVRLQIGSREKDAYHK